MNNGQVSIYEQKYTDEEQKRIGIDLKSDFQLVSLFVHAVGGKERTDMCFHTQHTYYIPDKDETVGVLEVLRQKWDAGGYYLKPTAINHRETRSSLGDDPTIGRLP